MKSALIIASMFVSSVAIAQEFKASATGSHRNGIMACVAASQKACRIAEAECMRTYNDKQVCERQCSDDTHDFPETRGGRATCSVNVTVRPELRNLSVSMPNSPRLIQLQFQNDQHCRQAATALASGSPASVPGSIGSVAISTGCYAGGLMHVNFLPVRHSGGYRQELSMEYRGFASLEFCDSARLIMNNMSNSQVTVSAVSACNGQTRGKIGLFSERTWQEAPYEFSFRVGLN